MSKQPMQHQAMWDSLGPRVDLAIVGGGATGAGIAREAALRGLQVALLEADDFAAATSSRSSKLVHGGLRYLEHYDFRLVFEALRERQVLLRTAPHLVQPLPFLFPVYEQSRLSLGLLRLGMWLYSTLALFRSPGRHRLLRPEKVASLEPALNVARLEGAAFYYDAAAHDARLVLENVLDAAGQGAVICSHANVVELKASGRFIDTLHVQNRFTGEVKTIEARLVVNATGPWSDVTRRIAGSSEEQSLLHRTKGAHIVVRRSRLPLHQAVVCVHPQDERVLFAVPWGDCAYLGTTDTEFEGDPGDVTVTAQDVHYLLDAARHFFPERELSETDVISTWAGVRPLLRPAEIASNEGVSREHRVLVEPTGLVTVSGGKLTTYRSMAREAVARAVEVLGQRGRHKPSARAPTHKRPLPGAVGFDDSLSGWQVDEVLRTSNGTLDRDAAEMLAQTYGSRAVRVAKRCARQPELAAPLVRGRSELRAQIDFAVEEELAATVSDFMIRRTLLFYKDPDQGLAAVEAVAQRMGDLLSWNEARRKQEVDAYRREVDRSRAWRASSSDGPV